MKNAILFFALFFIASSTFAQNSDKTLVKTMDAKGASSINFDFRNKGIKADPWDAGTIRVELEITANFPEAVLAQLVKAGRYTLSSNLEGDVLNVQAKNLEKTVTIGGKDLDDHVRIYIQTPGYYAVAEGQLKKTLDPAIVEGIVGRASDMKDAQAQIKEISKIKEKIDVTFKFVYKKDGDKPTTADKIDARGDRQAAGKDPKDNGFIQSKESRLNKNSPLKEVEAMYGDIIVGGKPITDFD